MALRSNRSKIEYAEREDLEEKPAAFMYPNFIEPMYVMDFDDLDRDCLFMICQKEPKKVYIWKGELFEEEDIVNY